MPHSQCYHGMDCAVACCAVTCSSCVQPAPLPRLCLSIPRGRPRNRASGCIVDGGQVRCAVSARAKEAKRRSRVQRRHVRRGRLLRSTLFCVSDGVPSRLACALLHSADFHCTRLSLGGPVLAVQVQSCVPTVATVALATKAPAAKQRANLPPRWNAIKDSG